MRRAGKTAAFLAAIVLFHANPVRGDDRAQIRAVMDTQVAAWNRGDLEAFLESYIKSPELLFASRGTFARGWESLLERYRKTYPEGEMGHLSFDSLEVRMLSADAAWVTGMWALEKTDASPHGAFTLIFRKTDDGWRIIHDHSSGVPEKKQE